MTTLTSELENLKYAPLAQTTVVACADLARRAFAMGDDFTGVRSKSLELYFSGRLGSLKHAIVVAAEGVERWPEVRAKANLDERVASEFLYVMSAGLSLATQDIDVPIATLREFLEVVRQSQESLQLVPILSWETEADIADLEGDFATRDAIVARIAPHLGWRSRVEQQAACPGCTVITLAKYLDDATPPEVYEEMFEPMRGKRPFPGDAGPPRFFQPEGEECLSFEMNAQWYLAEACLKAGRIAEAKFHALRLDAAISAEDTNWRLAASQLELKIALAEGDLGNVERLVAWVEANVDADDSPYQALELAILLHSAHGALGHTTNADSFRTRALAAAQRMDARISRPRHVEKTTRRLKSELERAMRAAGRSP